MSVGNIGGYDRDDLLGIWDSGLWVRYSNDSSWQKISAKVPTWITVAGMNDNNRSDIVCSYENGTWYRDSATEAWSHIARPSELLIASDIDGDGKDDLIGIWSGEVWVRYGETGQWELIAPSKPIWIFTSMIADAVQSAGSLNDPSEADNGKEIVDLLIKGPGGAANSRVFPDEKGPAMKD